MIRVLTVYSKTFYFVDKGTQRGAVYEFVRGPPEIVRSKDRRWDISRKRAEAVAILVREYGYGVSEVAKYLGRDQANVSTMLSRLSARQTERE
jgi:DNA-binding MarR family transcriptional regulator